MRARRFLFCAAAALALAACQSTGADRIETAQVYDVLIENGQVYTGEDVPAQNLMIAISGDKIAYAGPPKPASAKRRIDAAGHMVLPGFIDPHTHALSDLRHKSAEKREARAWQFQGVTTVMIGNDGGGSPYIHKKLTRFGKNGIGTNAALYVGHGQLRRTVMGDEDRAPSAAEMQEMKTLLAAGMEAGAIGFSSGLYYAPGSFSQTDEVIELAKVAAKYGGVYDSHMRSEGKGVASALDELITIAREAKIPAHISHIKALGPGVWGQSETMIARIEAARANGLHITADQYPWTASSTSISAALLPRWLKAGGKDRLQERLRDPALREKIRSESAGLLRGRGGPDSILLTVTPDDYPQWQGKTLTQAAAMENLSPVDMTIKIVQSGGAKIASFNMDEDDIENFMRQSWVMTGSDGGNGHPRKFASFPKKYRDYVIGKSIMPVHTFIHQSSGLTADTFGLCDRGYLRAGYAADIAIIDPDAFAPIADYENPYELSAGVKTLLVNGEFAIDDSKAQTALAGRVVKPCR